MAVTHSSRSSSVEVQRKTSAPLMMMQKQFGLKGVGAGAARRSASEGSDKGAGPHSLQLHWRTAQRRSRPACGGRSCPRR